MPCCSKGSSKETYVFVRIALPLLKAPDFSCILEKTKEEAEKTVQAVLLLVEDDAVLRGALSELFTREGYRVIEAASVREAREKLNHEVQAVVLDVGLPDGDGVTLCRAWREAGEQRPILFLTAKDEELDVVRALDSGGNDYVTKPFRMQELLSRVRVLLRSAKPQTVQRDSFSVDKGKMQIVRDGEALPLTLTEYKIVKMLMERRGVVPRNLLLEVLWDDGSKFIDDNTLSVHMSRLREKIGGSHIKTIRGVGYQWSEP